MHCPNLLKFTRWKVDSFRRHPPTEDGMGEWTLGGQEKGEGIGWREVEGESEDTREGMDGKEVRAEIVG